MQTKYLALTILAVSLLVRPAAGENPADLLQKGIYNQETVGDLDAAIRIYRQVVASSAASREYAAQAQFRLGVCLLGKGETAEARKAFEQLIKDYPEQKELVARAREHIPADFKLLPAPWTNGEQLEYEMKTAAGLTMGAMVLTVEPNAPRPGNVVFENRTYTPTGPTQGSRVEVERDSMQPVALSYFNMAFGKTSIRYEGRQARVELPGKPPATIPLDGPTFDNEEVLYLVRRLPLEAGYKGTLPIISPMGVPVKLEIAVLATEDVEVPAGKFRCHRFEFGGITQTYWIATEEPRPIVKIGVGAISIELASVGRVGPLTPVEYRDAKTGLTFTAAPRWIMMPNPLMQAVDETSVQMFDPEMKAAVALWGKKSSRDPADIARQLREAVDAKQKSRQAALKDYRVRPESIQPRQIGGQQALSCIADYSDPMLKSPMVEYLVWVYSAETACQFFARVSASDFEEFRKRFDPIVETVRLQ